MDTRWRIRAHPAAALRRRSRMVLALVAVVALLAGCRADAVVTVEVVEEGSGTVTVALVLDAEAATRLGDPESVLALDDLEAGGWTVTGPSPGADGGVEVAASKPFANPEQFAAVMDEIAGPSGVLEGFELERSRSFATTTYDVTGTIDLTGGIEAFGDEALAAALGGRPVGWTPEDLEAELGVPLDEALGLSVAVDLPGEASGDGAEDVDGVAVWQAELGAPSVVTIDATGGVTDSTARTWAVVAAAAVLALAAWVVLMVVRRRHRPVTDGLTYTDTGPAPVVAGTVPVVTGTAPLVAATDAPPTPRASTPRRRLELVVLGGPGVVFEVAEIERRLLRPFVRDLGGEVALELVEDVYTDATLGRLSSAELWTELGFSGDVRSLDRAFLGRQRLSPDVTEFLERVRHRSLGVAVLANDLATWSGWSRRKFGLDELVDHWLVSAELGVRVPDPVAFETLRRTTGVAYANCLYIEHDRAALDLAAEMGMATAWFMPPPDADPDGPHRLVRGFRSVFRSRA